MKKTLAIFGCALSAMLSAMANEQDEGWRMVHYSISWGGPYGESPYMPEEYPGCSMLYTDWARWEKEGGDGYGDLWIENHSDNLPCYIYRNDVLIATNYTNVTGWNEYTDYDVVPGRKYKYEIRSNGYTNATTGPLFITCNYIYKADLDLNDVVFSANEEEIDIRVLIYKQTASGDILNNALLGYYDSYFTVSVPSNAGSWIYADRSDIDGIDGSHFCRIEVTANDTDSPREAIVTIEFEGFKWPIKVRQEAKSDNVTVNTDSGKVSIPKTWFADECPSILQENGNDHTLTALATAANGYKVWECYVAGISPTNAVARFTAQIEVKNGVPWVTWSPNLNTNGIVRNYTVLGKTNLTDSDDWAPTNSVHRFFKVKVEIP